MRSRAALLAKWVAAALVVGVWVLLLRPVSLGGPATYLIVRGSSMLPTFETGELIVLQAAPAYAVGDAIGYHVPAGEVGAGRIIIHRIIGRTGDGFMMQGDNNPAPDPWTPAPSDVAGRVWVAVPVVGRVIDWLRQPAVLGALAAAIVVAVLIGRAPAGTPRSRDRVTADLG